MAGRLLTARAVADMLDVSTRRCCAGPAAGSCRRSGFPGGAIRFREERSTAGLKNGRRRGEERQPPRRAPPGRYATGVNHPRRRGGLDATDSDEAGVQARPDRWGLRYYDADGSAGRKSPFPSKSAALAHYRDVIEPQLRGEPVPMPELTLAEFVPIYLERHAASVRPRTIDALRWRLGVATRGVRRRAAPRPGAHERRDCGLAGHAARSAPGSPSRRRSGRLSTRLSGGAT